MSSFEKESLISGTPVVASQPLPAGAPPAYSPYAQKPGARLDNLSAQKLMAVNSFGLLQGNHIGETVAPGCFANRYMITDRQRLIAVQGREEDLVETPLWIVQEESDCCCRLCCCGKQPLLAKFYHAQMPVAGEMVCCGCCYTGHQYRPDMTQPVVMTLERDGCCSKWIGCWICGPKCQSEAWLHAGNIDGKPGHLATSNEQTVIGRSQVPANVCFTPKLDVLSGPGSTETAIGQMSGPCFFGGCLDLCVDTRFQLSSQKDAGNQGDVGTIWKEAPKNCCGMCMQACGDVDNYSVDFKANQMSPEDKANYIATAVHLDYWFFQQDVRPVKVYHNGKNGIIVITLCNFFCKGMICPIQICIPYGGK